MNRAKAPAEQRPQCEREGRAYRLAGCTLLGCLKMGIPFINMVSWAQTQGAEKTRFDTINCLGTISDYRIDINL